MSKELKVHIGWTGDNFCASYEVEGLGVIAVTGKTLMQLKKEFEEAMEMSVEGWIEDGETVPAPLSAAERNYVYELDAAALIREAEAYTTMSVISRFSGINAKQLSHYANGVKHPRPAQLDKIKRALSSIGACMIAMG